MNKLEQVLKKIREVSPKIEEIMIMKYYACGNCNGYGKIQKGYHVDYGEITGCCKECNGEGFVDRNVILLEHLLCAIGGDCGIFGDGTLCVYSENQRYECGNPWKRVAIYDLTKSVEQNLTDNPELLDLVAELLGVE